MTIVGYAILFSLRSEKNEDTASEKTPMQWHECTGNHRGTVYEPIMSFSLASAMELTLPSYCLVNS